jgi:hypothetical protein
MISARLESVDSPALEEEEAALYVNDPSPSSSSS